MSDQNVYEAPASDVSVTPSASDYGPLRIFTMDGRIGRLRLLAYTTGFTLLFYLAIGLVGAVLAMLTGGSDVLAMLFGIAYFVVMIGLLIMTLIWTVRRCHDFNATGWLALLTLIPLVNLIFFFIPGTKGDNKYGPPPPPNSTGVIVTACIFPAIIVIGILAAIAIPAYQDYVIRAQGAALVEWSQLIRVA